MYGAAEREKGLINLWMRYHGNNKQRNDMSSIIYDWEVKLRTGAIDMFGAPEPAMTDSEIVFKLEEGGEKNYQKSDVVSFRPTGFRPFIV